MLFDAAVDATPVTILLSFVVPFLAVGSYPTDQPVTVVQVSLIAVPPLLLVALTYDAVRAVTAAERGGDAGDDRPSLGGQPPLVAVGLDDAVGG